MLHSDADCKASIVFSSWEHLVQTDQCMECKITHFSVFVFLAKMFFFFAYNMSENVL